MRTRTSAASSRRCSTPPAAEPVRVPPRPTATVGSTDGFGLKGAPEMSRPRRVFGMAVAAGLIVGGMAIPASTTAHREPWKVVASGLDNPRHLAFAPGGDLYVAEAGRGGTAPCVAAPGLGFVLPRVHRGRDPGQRQRAGQAGGQGPAVDHQPGRRDPRTLGPRVQQQAQVRAQHRSRRQRRVPRGVR